MTEHDGEADGEGIGRRAAMKSVAALVATGAAGAASAQETTASPATATPTATESGETVAIELGPVRIKSWEHDGEEFRITFGADYPSAVKITDTGAMMGAMTTGSGAGITEIPTRGLTVKDGRTVTYAAEEFDGAYAISVASSDGAALIRTDAVDAGSPAVEMSTAIGTTAAAAVGSGWYSFRRGREKLEETDEPQIDRIG